MDIRLKYLIDPYIYYRHVANISQEEFDADMIISKHIKVARYSEFPQELYNDIQASYVLLGHVPYELFEKLEEVIRVRWLYWHHLMRWSEALQVQSAVTAYAREVVGLTDLYSEQEMANILHLQVAFKQWSDLQFTNMGRILDKLRDMSYWIQAQGGE